MSTQYVCLYEYECDILYEIIFSLGGINSILVCSKSMSLSPMVPVTGLLMLVDAGVVAVL